MEKQSRYSKRSRIVRTCCLTALVNSFVCAYGQQDVLVQPQFEPKPDPGDNPLHYGPFDFLPRVRGSVTYDDNIYIQPAGKQHDVIWTLSPGLMLGAGDYIEREVSSFTVDYAPSFNLFTTTSGNNSIDHEGRLEGDWRTGKWSLGLQQIYQNYSGPVLDVGNRVSRSIYRTGLKFGYEISPKTSVEVSGTQLIADFSTISSYNEWTAAGFFDYAVTPKLKVGVGVNAGWADIQNAVNQRYQQGLVRAVYSASEKVDIRGSAGIELREFQSGQSDRVNGVFSVGGTYRPLEHTEVLLDLYRRDQSSVVLVNQNYTTTGFAAAVRQAVFVNYAVSLAGGYDHLDYHATSPGVVAVRQDNYFFVRAGVDWKALQWLTASAAYFYRKNNSSSGAFSFDNHQVGLNLAYQF